ncbi:unnamed protein product [Caenorhabditis sp. 36 PRJEB53466]|nr:unnamed protein product [Caenorhabditis sp. 36 PRJEB53466]
MSKDEQIEYYRFKINEHFPDLNPIDFAVCGYLTQLGSTKNCSSLGSLKVALKKAWDDLDVNYLRASYPKRLMAVIKAKGGRFTSADGRAPFRTSYVFMTAENRKTNEKVQTCVNYQQFHLANTPKSIVAESYETAEPRHLKYWSELSRSTRLCPLPDSTHSLLDSDRSNDVVPMDYRIDGGDLCSHQFTHNDTAFRKAAQATVNAVKKYLNASTALLIMDKKRRFVQGWSDYLFADFYDPNMDNINSIPTFYMYRTEFDKISQLATLDEMNRDGLEIRFFRPRGPPFDYSIVAIWLIAMTCVTVGGFWANHRMRNGKDLHALLALNRDQSETEREGEDASPSFATKHANAISIVMMMVALCAVLMLGYFFRPVLVFIFNILLVFFGAASINGCIRGFLSNFSFSEHRWYNAKIEWLPTFGGKHEYTYTSAATVLFSLSVCTTWFFLRRNPYAFVLLDLINMALCVHVLKCLRLPSLKWISILMLCMFLYDAFMVFGTAQFTSNGCSVMLEVATGTSNCKTDRNGQKAVGENGYPVPPVEFPSPEKFPMLFQVPHWDPMNECLDFDVDLGFQTTILGLGDIVMPGYLVAHCFTMHGFSEGARILYGTISIGGYGIGLIVTFIALSLMGIAQPALIYLVPCTLLPIILLSICRGEFRKIWDGEVMETEHERSRKEMLRKISSESPTSSQEGDETPQNPFSHSTTNGPANV